MTQEGKFGVTEAISLAVITSTAKVFYTSPALVMKITGSAGWYMTIISAVAAAAGFFFCYLLLKRFPKKNLMEIYDMTLGKALGFIFSIALAGILFVEVIINLREFTDVIKVYTYRNSPPEFLLILFMLAVVVLSCLGLETIVRYAKFMVFFLALALAVILLLSWQNYEFYRIFPIYGHGIKTTITNGIMRSSGYGEIIIIAVFAGSLQGIGHVKKAVFMSLMISAFVVSVSILSFTLTFPYYVGQELTAPFYVQASLIEYGSFLQRLEPIFFVVWNLTTIISITALFYTVLLIYCHMFRLDDKRPLIMPLSVIISLLTIAPESIFKVAKSYEQMLRSFGAVFFFVPPIIALIVSLIRKRKVIINNA